MARARGTAGHGGDGGGRPPPEGSVPARDGLDRAGSWSGGPPPPWRRPDTPWRSPSHRPRATGHRPGAGPGPGADLPRRRRRLRDRVEEHPAARRQRAPRRAGAVRPEAAAQTARGIRTATGATYGLAVTGVAGPSPQDGRPVGTVHVALATGRATVTARPTPGSGRRADIRCETVLAALLLLRDRPRPDARTPGRPPRDPALPEPVGAGRPRVRRA
ncbi:CinA family protein [Kitasatospora sp. NPDC056327]|uniref:CinA family protein n=1 Tax=Kitasatospora sp. NPDC056327 TaxID=3345785 RepID=UPI0035D5E4DB